MNWIQSLSKAIHYIEEHLTEDIKISEVSHHTYTSSSHFQLIFHVVMGMTVDEYIRNRRLSLAAQDYDILFMHHYGLGVDVGQWHGVWERFMRADTPIPDGFISIDFTAQMVPGVGSPYYSRFAFATFSGDMHAMHSQEGFDSDAMYPVFTPIKNSVSIKSQEQMYEFMKSTLTYIYHNPDVLGITNADDEQVPKMTRVFAFIHGRYMGKTYKAVDFLRI